MGRLCLAAGLLLVAAMAANAQDYQAGTTEIASPWARATPKGASVTAGYMRITNRGERPDRLLGGWSSAAGTCEIQEMSFADNVMRLRTLARGLEIGAGQTLDLKPGSAYLFIFSSLARGLEPGEQVKATLLFEQAGKVDIEYAVQPIGSRGSRGAQAAALD